MHSLHVAFPAGVSAMVRAEAAKRGVTPQNLVKSAMACAIEGNLLDAIFDGLEPDGMAIGHARRLNGLTYLQCAVLYLIAHHGDARGVCHLSSYRFHAMIGKSSPSNVALVVRKLVDLGLVARVKKDFAGGVQPHALTPAGKAIAGELSGMEL